MEVPPVMSLGDVAQRFGCQLWEVRRLYERRLLPEPPRAGNARIIFAADLPKVEAALRSAGYIPAVPEPAACAG